MIATRSQVQNSTHQTNDALVYRIQSAITLALAVGAVAAFVLYFIAALSWRGQPFIGVMLTHTLAVNRGQPVNDATWNGLEAGLRAGDRLLSINGVPLDGNFATARATLEQVRSTLTPGAELIVTFSRGEGATQTVTYPVMNGLPDADFFVFFIIPFLSGLIVLAIGLVTLWVKRETLEALVCAAICFTMAIFMAGLFDLATTHNLPRIWLLGGTLLGGNLAALGMIFPVRSMLSHKNPHVIFIPIGISAVVGVVVALMYDQGPTGNFGTASLLTVLTAMIGSFVMAGFVYYRYRKAATRLVYDQTSLILVGFLLSMMPGILWLAAQIFNFQESMVSIEAMVPFLITPIFGLTVALFNPKQVDTDVVFSRSVTYLVLLVALIAGYFLLVLGASLIAGQLLPANNPTLIAFALFLVAVLFIPVRTSLQNRIDTIYYRRRINYQEKQEIFARDISELSSSDISTPIRLFRELLDSTLAPENIFIFLPNVRGGGEYVAYGEKRPETDVVFMPDSGVVELLKRDTEVHYLDPTRPMRVELLIDRARLGILRSTVIAGLVSQNNLNGILSIGPSRSGQAYTHEELRFIDALVRQLSVAIERAQSFDSLERRVAELDVLSQVGQAVNFTIEFNDLLELISTRTSRLLASPHFYITLHDPNANQMYFAFYVENDERYPEKENLRWKVGNDLFSEIVRTNQPRRVDDYNKAVAESGYDAVLQDSDIHAWMGVPLIAGATTLGAMAVGKLKQGETYSADQLRIFNNIGALAATSIDKARLFDEVNVRARQLAVLNEISQKLVVAEAGEIEALLQLITASAVQILNAEAGSLLLKADDDTGDMIFRVAIGGASSELMGRRMPAGRGLVGEVVRTGKPVIANDTRKDERWKGEITKTGEFKTSSILAVPLSAKDQIIGVLEVLNKLDGTLFVKEEVELLTTFAGQAAIAIENTRLFQMTGSQLNKRLEELETLERIDFELNRTLDIQRVAEITVRWTVASSGAVAGALGLVEGAPPYLRILATYGYKPEEYPAGAEDKRWPLDKGIVKRVRRTLQADLADPKIDPDYVPSLTGATSQITVPMLSGGELNAILILETNKEQRFNLLDLTFVQRIAEHASIAVANALLLQQLQFAAETKSEFVGFAAHELKNPLASVIGYADLLKSEMAGPLTDMQKNFATVVRSNADRMQTIIDDLRDVAALDANKLRMEIQPMNFHKVVEDTLITFEQRLEEKQQTVKNLVGTDLPLIMGDHKRLVQVMTNLVSNAHKYSEEGKEITISAEVNRNFRTRQGQALGPVLHVRIKDQGIGMDEKDLARIFQEDYFRSENEKARQQKGTGLGMMITQRFIESHGGKIWVESVINQGSTFHFVVPLAPTANDSEADDHRAPTQMRSTKTEPHLQIPDNVKSSREPASD